MVETFLMKMYNEDIRYGEDKGKIEMRLFSKSEVVIARESTNAKVYLEELEKLLKEADGEVREKIQREIAITKAGIAGEDNILFELKNSNMDLIILHDIYIETKDGQSAQIDFIVIAPKLTYLIECKNLYGNIEINSKGNFIRNMEYGGKWHKEGIYSPVTQNVRHMEILKERCAEDKNRIMEFGFRRFFDNFYKSFIVLANPKTIVNDRYAPKEIKSQVLRADQLVTAIKRLEDTSKEMASSQKQMKERAESLLTKNCEKRKDYVEKYQKIMEDVRENNRKTKETEPPQEKEKLICPKCGALLVPRVAKKGENAGKKFYGCSQFPKCRFIMNIE